MAEKSLWGLFAPYAFARSGGGQRCR